MITTASRSYGQKLIVGSSYSYVALIINKVATAISSIFIARFLGPTNLGMISIVNYLFALLLFFTGLGIPTAIVKLISEYHQHEKEDIGRFITMTFIINLVIIVLVVGLYYWGAAYIANRIYHEAKLAFLIKISSMTLFFFSINQFGNAVIQAFAEFKRLSLLTIFNSIFGLLLLIPLTKIWGLRGTVISQAVASAITFILVLLVINLIKRKNRLIFPFSINQFSKGVKIYLGKLFSLALPVFISGLFMSPALMILTTFLTRLRGFNDVGYFNVSYALTQIILFVPNAIGVPFIPLATKLAVEDPKRLTNFMLKTIYGATVVVLIFSFVMSFFSRQILNILYGDKFLSSQNILILMSAATFLASFGYIIGYYLLAIGKMWLATLLNLVWFIAIIAPAYHLIKYLGVEGLGMSYLSSYILLSIIFIFYIRNYLKTNINKIALYMVIGTIFPILLLVMNHNSAKPVFYVVLLIVFVISLIMIVPKMIDKTLVIELFRKKIGLAYNDNEHR